MNAVIASTVVVLGLISGFLFVVIFILPSIKKIGPTEVGLVTKRFGKKLSRDNAVAFDGEAGYQAELLMPGFRFKLWAAFRVEKFPWVQVPAGQVGVVYAQIGEPLPLGAKTAKYKKEFGDFTDLNTFVNEGGRKGIQRPVLRSGATLPIHPIAFLVITKDRVYGRPVDADLLREAEQGVLLPGAFGLAAEQLNVVRIEPRPSGEGQMIDTVGVVTTLEGDPLASGHIASRLGGFDDIMEMEKAGENDAALIDALLGDRNELHDNYQDFQTFLDRGGKMGLQHDVLRYGAYNFNPFLVSVEIMPMLVVDQGEVAVIKAYVGLSTEDTSGEGFKFGSLVRPGRRGLWRDSLRTGKYALNPRIYQAEIVPTAILTLNWAEAVSTAHSYDKHLEPIIAKSSEGFIFTLDLQVQIHVPDTQAPRVISMVGTMRNLVTEVLQAAVGNHFRDKLQSMRAIVFIETRQQVQEEAFQHIKAQLNLYEVETYGVYIQNVELPAAMVRVLTEREIANQEVATYEKQEAAQRQRVKTEQAKGTADMQAELARATVGIEIKTNDAKARKAEGDGEAEYIQRTGTARGAEVEAVGLAKARGYQAQVEALGRTETALVNIATAVSQGNVPFMPDTLVVGGEGSLGGLAGTLMGYLKKLPGAAEAAEAAGKKGDKKTPPRPDVPPAPPARASK
jgi:hypothetical protein